MASPAVSQPSDTLSSLESLLGKATQPPWFGFYLIPTGYLVVPAFHTTFGPAGPAWALVAVLLCLLLGLRVGAALLRRRLPVPRTVANAWTQNRILAKRYDSYQWQKLFWIGVGILIYALPLAGSQVTPIGLAFTCLASGGLGVLRWCSMRPEIAAGTS